MAQHKNSVYGKISKDIADKINSGVYKKGEALEPERKLMEIYGVERTTVRRALDLLVKDGIIVNIYNSYEYNGLNEIKPSMIAESLENARNAADEFAKNSRSKIGKMRTASQGYFEVEDLDENTPQIKKIRVVTTVEYYLK